MRKQGGPPHLQRAGWVLVRAKQACLATSREGVNPPGFSFLDPWAIRRELVSPGWRLICLGAVGSTNDVAGRAGQRGLPERLAVFAELQTRGRGQRGRAWQAPTGRGLLVSTLWRPPVAGADLGGMAQVCGVAAVEALGALGAPAGLKWPNDLMLGGAKAGGILIETAFVAGRVDHLVAGIGINVLQGADELPPTPYPATSVRLATGRAIDRTVLAARLLDRLAATYDEWLRAPESVFGRWRGVLETLGRRVLVEGPNGRVAGLARDVEPDGALLLEQADGRVARLVSGEVSVRVP